MFLYKPKIRNTYLISLTKDEKAVLYQLLVNNIDKKCQIIVIKNRKTIISALYHLFEKVIELIPAKKDNEEENLNSENFLQF